MFSFTVLYPNTSRLAVFLDEGTWPAILFCVCVPPRMGRVFYLDKARVQSLTQAAPAWCDWEVVRAGGVSLWWFKRTFDYTISEAKF